MNDHEMPLGHRLPDGRVRILLAARDAGLIRSWGAHLDSLAQSVEWDKAKTGFEAGRKIASFHPDMLIPDLRLPGADAMALCEDLSSDPETQGMEILVLGEASEAPGVEALGAKGICELLGRTVDPDRISTAISRKASG